MTTSWAGLWTSCEEIRTVPLEKGADGQSHEAASMAEGSDAFGDGDGSIEVCRCNDGGYLALMPDLAGCIGEGDTPEAAREDCRKAAVEWLDEMHRLGRSH